VATTDGTLPETGLRKDTNWWGAFVIGLPAVRLARPGRVLRVPAAAPGHAAAVPAVAIAADGTMTGATGATGLTEAAGDPVTRPEPSAGEPPAARWGHGMRLGRRGWDRPPTAAAGVLLASPGGPFSRAAIRRACELAGGEPVAVLSILKVYGSSFGMPNPGSPRRYSPKPRSSRPTSSCWAARAAANSPPACSAASPCGSCAGRAAR
jgi:hypothetical protein